MNTTPQEAPIVHLRGGRVSIVIELAQPVPRVLHWGADLGELNGDDLDTLRLSAIPPVTHNSTNDPRHFSVVPTGADAWAGTPGIAGHLSHGTAFPRFRLESHTSGQNALDMVLADDAAGLRLGLGFRLETNGVLAFDAELDRGEDAVGEYRLESLTALLPLPERAVEIVDFTGKWSRERSPQRQEIRAGTHLRESRRGRPSLDSPYLLMAGTRSFGFRSGEVWATHVAWSGNQRYLLEQLPEGAGEYRSVFGGGELLLPGEVVLGPGDTYTTPTVYFAWSDAGMDGIAGSFHSMLRERQVHPKSPRPLVLNTWEAVYFEHNLETLLDLVDRAAEVGVERMVLDDGWFDGRRNDTTGLGDWHVDATVWPSGLTPLVDRVREHGMQFGLWFEPEMVNLTSKVAKAHPDWILGPSEDPGPAVRHQHVLNLAHDDAWHYVLTCIADLVAKYRIDFIKWDHNRELYEPAQRQLRDSAGAHAQTLALYRMLDELRRRHPGLEIESCASGGGRVDLGILGRTERIWTSDCNDPVERQNIQRWTSQLLPPELIGAHVAAIEDHTTHRMTALPFRLATALFGHAGIEMDLTACTADEREVLRAWSRLYKELRGLLHSGRLVRADLADPATLLTGVVAQDGSEALFSWSRLHTSPPGHAGRVRIPGLDPHRGYRITARTELGEPSLHEKPPAWLAVARADGHLATGVLLGAVGLPMPTLNPQQALLLHATAV